MRADLESAGDELRRFQDERRAYAALSERMYEVCEDLHRLSYGDDHDDGGAPAGAGAPADDPPGAVAPAPIAEDDDDDADLDGHADAGHVEPCEWDGGDDLGSPPRSPSTSPTRTSPPPAHDADFAS